MVKYFGHMIDSLLKLDHRGETHWSFPNRVCMTRYQLNASSVSRHDIHNKG